MRMTKSILLVIVKHEHRAFTFCVRLFTVLRDIHSDTLGANRRAERDHEANQLENSECSHAGIHDRCDDTDCLYSELCGMSKQQSVRSTPSRFREYSRKERTTHSAYPVCPQH